MAQGTVISAEMILGKQSQVSVLSVTVDSTIQSTLSEIKETVSHFEGEEWVILTDILGGTPFNASYRFLEEHPDVLLVAGFNLPLLLELFMRVDASHDEIKQYINTHKDAVISVVEYQVPMEQEEEFDL